jgi:hypothetical protein
MTVEEKHAGGPTSEPESEPPSQAGPDGIEREIGHDEFDPEGTLALIAIYFTIIALLWLFMYFVEFMGNDPTVVGTMLHAFGSGVVA